VKATMKTMVKEPYVHHIPVLTGGVGYDGVYNFYKNDFVGKMPDDTNLYAFRVQLVKIRLLMNLF
jgi:carboxymethylenebutenolidase